MLLEVLCLNDFVHYFQSIHNNVMFEVKGVLINEAENDILVQTCVSETMKFKLVLLWLFVMYWSAVLLRMLNKGADPVLVWLPC